MTASRSARNPLKDMRVRRALSMAIDRHAIVERVMEGAAMPAGQFLPPGRLRLRRPTCRRRATTRTARKRLLAEAGYPNGFRIQLHGPNDRYINDCRIVQAVGQMWTRIGVRTAVEAQPWTTFVGRAGRQEFSAFLIGWGSNPEGSHPLRNIIATVSRDRGWGASNRGRYSNPAVDALLSVRWPSWMTRSASRCSGRCHAHGHDRCRRDPAAHPDQHLGDAARPDHTARARRADPGAGPAPRRALSQGRGAADDRLSCCAG